MALVNVWKGPFGDAYTDRQPRGLKPDVVLRTMCRPILDELRTVLEVGCNRGDNLIAWRPEASRIVGVEPNKHARHIAKGRGWPVYDGTTDRLPFRDNGFDLVYTAGVLIHVEPDRFDRAISEISRVASKWILCVEYHSPEQVSIPHRGVEDGIWKRPYRAEYENRVAGLTLIGEGDQSALAGTPFDGSSWWLWAKSSP